jgi:hypothetical protein
MRFVPLDSADRVALTNTTDGFARLNSAVNTRIPAFFTRFLDSVPPSSLSPAGDNPTIGAKHINGASISTSSSPWLQVLRRLSRSVPR